MRDTALIVPSIRKDSFDRFVTEWLETGLLKRVDLILVEDSPQKTFDISRVESGPAGAGEAEHRHFSWEDIDRHDWSWIIPRKSDTVRSYGYWYAWHAGYDYLMTLDDDCWPAEGYEELDLLHKSMLTRTRWFNTLNSVRPRGVPYQNLGKRDAHVNHGIWQGVLDYDAPQQLVNPTPEVYTHDNRIVPHGAFFPFCGMNVMWRREAIPLSYHLLMGHHVVVRDNRASFAQVNGIRTPFLKKLQFDRFGDIWSGIIQKKVCDHLGWVMSSGTPYIHHDRASNPFTNLRKEANGIEVNENFWNFIDDIELHGLTAIECYREIGHAISSFGGEHDSYWKQLSHAMTVWADLF